jgi:hypothetical protein
MLSKLLRRDWQPAPSGPLHANQFVKGRRGNVRCPLWKPTSQIGSRVLIPDSSRNRILQRRSEPRERLGHALKCSASNFVACEVLSQLQRVMENPRFLLAGECDPLRAGQRVRVYARRGPYVCIYPHDMISPCKWTLEKALSK